MQANFFSIDEYFNLKTVALLEPDSSKIPVQYAEKYIMIRKRMIFSNQVKDVSPRELKMMNMQPNQDTKVNTILFRLPSSAFLSRACSLLINSANWDFQCSYSIKGKNRDSRPIWSKADLYFSKEASKKDHITPIWSTQE